MINSTGAGYLQIFSWWIFKYFIWKFWKNKPRYSPSEKSSDDCFGWYKTTLITDSVEGAGVGQTLWNHFLAYCVAIKTTNDEVTTIHKTTDDVTTTPNEVVKTTTNTNAVTKANGILILKQNTPICNKIK